MNWSAEQQRLLRALGHDLMVHGTQWPLAPVAGPRAKETVGGAEAPPARATGATADNPKLREAVRRAAGGSDVSALIEDIERLRNEPALKRALWPRLRALRRSH